MSNVCVLSTKNTFLTLAPEKGGHRRSLSLTQSHEDEDELAAGDELTFCQEFNPEVVPNMDHIETEKHLPILPASLSSVSTIPSQSSTMIMSSPHNLTLPPPPIAENYGNKESYEDILTGGSQKLPNSGPLNSYCPLPNLQIYESDKTYDGFRSQTTKLCEELRMTTSSNQVYEEFQSTSIAHAPIVDQAIDQPIIDQTMLNQARLRQFDHQYLPQVFHQDQQYPRQITAYHDRNHPYNNMSDDPYRNRNDPSYNQMPSFGQMYGYGPSNEKQDINPYWPYTNDKQNIQDDSDKVSESSKTSTCSRRVNNLNEFAAEHIIDKKHWTSIMIRNIPCRYDQEALMTEIESKGYKLDFVYLPASKQSMGNLGYAFVNFVEPYMAAQFLRRFQDYSFMMQPNSKKRADLSFAKLQGFDVNVRFYSKAKVSKGCHHPWVDQKKYEKFQKMNSQQNIQKFRS